MVGVRALESGKRWFEERSGVQPVDGGPHPGLGTHNALFAVQSADHPRCYVEILAPDPKQTVSSPVAQGLSEMDEPALFHWALRTKNLGMLAEQLRADGVAAGQPFDASRQRPDVVCSSGSCSAFTRDGGWRRSSSTGWSAFIQPTRRRSWANSKSFASSFPKAPRSREPSVQGFVD